MTVEQQLVAILRAVAALTGLYDAPKSIHCMGGGDRGLLHFWSSPGTQARSCFGESGLTALARMSGTSPSEPAAICDRYISCQQAATHHCFDFAAGRAWRPAA